jgi:hypothetical protein
MKVIYVAGPYRAKTTHGVLENIRRAEQVAIEVWRAGHIAICPHMNSAFFDGLVPDEVFLHGTIELLKRSDGLVLVTGWHESTGTLAEMRHCLNNRIPVYFDAYELSKGQNLSYESLETLIGDESPSHPVKF